MIIYARLEYYYNKDTNYVLTCESKINAIARGHHKSNLVLDPLLPVRSILRIETISFGRAEALNQPADRIFCYLQRKILYARVSLPFVTTRNYQRQAT